MPPAVSFFCEATNFRLSSFDFFRLSFMVSQSKFEYSNYQNQSSSRAVSGFRASPRCAMPVWLALHIADCTATGRSRSLCSRLEQVQIARTQGGPSELTADPPPT